MRITILAVGRERRGPVRALVDEYRARCPWPIAEIEIVAPRQATAAARAAAEADRLLQALPDGARILALDGRGQALDSAGFAQLLAGYRDRGERDLAFLIGGPDGFAPAVRQRAERLLALGPMTWPHRLVRVLLAEQLYRASTILAGHPYHRG